MSVINKNFTYIDLFAGIGGFRQAMIKYSGGKAVCLYSSEINEQAANTYKINYNEESLGDIKKIDPIKTHLQSPDVICGGFPCQTFSKQTNKFKNRVNDKKWTLLNYFTKHINKVKPDIISMENVPELTKFDIFNDFKNNLTNFCSKPLRPNFLIAILFFFIGKSLKIISSIFSFINVSICKSSKISKISSLINLVGSNSMFLPLQLTVN